MLFPKIDHEAPIWQSAARSLWLGLVLYLIETDSLAVTMGEVLRQLTLGDERLKAILQQRQQSEKPLSSPCYLSLKEYTDTPEKTRGSVRKVFTTALELFYNPIIDQVTARNDFDLRDLRKKPISIYIGITPDDLDRLAPLINLFFQQVIDLNTREMNTQNSTITHQCLLLMDEFTAMGKVGVLAKSIAYIASYGLRLLPIIQSPSQLRATYGTDVAETLIENHALHILFAPKNNKVAKEISDTLGTQTVKHHTKTKQLFGKSSRSISSSETTRPLLLPQEVQQMGDTTAVLVLENCPPIRCHKIKWYQDAPFIDRGNGRDAIKWPSPTVPMIILENRSTDTIDDWQPVEKKQGHRPVTMDDIKNFENLTLEDFNADFTKMTFPEGKIDESNVDDLVAQFFEAFNTTDAGN